VKKNRKLLGVFLIIIALVIMQLPRSEADAATTSASDFKIEGTTLVKYTGTAQSVEVPNTVDTIGETAFEENLNIVKVTLPNSVKKIEAYSFWGCDNLETVVLGSGLTCVDDYAFANCKGLQSMTLPSNIKSIGIMAFEDCVNLTDITIPVQTTEIHETAFEGCPHVVIHSESGSYADKYAQELYERQLEMPEYEDVSDYQPDSTVTVVVDPTPDTDNTDAASDDSSSSGSSASGTGQDTVGNVIGSTKVVGNQAVVFIDNTAPTVMSGIPDDSTAAQNQTSSDTSIVGNTAANSIYPKYTIVNSDTVADQAYYRSTKLSDVSLPSVINEIGEFAYARSSITELTVPEGVETIGYGAFYHCDNLNSVSLPSTLTCVEPKAFTHSAWVDSFLEGITGDSDFLISGNVLVAYRGNAAEVYVPDGVYLIAGEAFYGHDEITKLTLPDSLKTIGEGAFEGCSSLLDVSFGSNIEAVKDRAFAECGLSQVSLPQSLKTVGIGAFDDSVNVTYEGSAPTVTHELSAERLSNENYRKTVQDTEAAGVTVKGDNEAYARLEGAVRRYTLTITDDEGRDTLNNAFLKSTGKALPDDTMVVDMTLTDNSDIEITKLGKQALIVTLTLPEDFAGKAVSVVTTDRNGQLESVQSERVSSYGKDCIRITTTHLSAFGIYSDGTALDEETVIEDTTDISSLSAPVQEKTGVLDFLSRIPYRMILSAALMLAGVVFIFHTTKYIK
jgi:hypothetical protein